MADLVRSRLLALAVVALALLAGGLGLDRWQSGETALAAPSSCIYSGGGPAFRIDSFEGDSTRELHQQTQVLAATNRLFPGDEEFALPALKVGNERRESPNATVPTQLLHAISWIESKNTQAHGDVPWGDIGPSLISGDCGYGIMQVTSSINNDGGLPSRYEALVGSHFAYNIAAGARILAEKWNEDYFPVVGESDPEFIESWYFALWAYNGWTRGNHPGNEAYDPGRRPYDCVGDWKGSYPYQEAVLGCVINPPFVNGQRLWDPHPVVLPDIPSLTVPGGSLDPDLFAQRVDDIRERMSLALPGQARQAWTTANDIVADRAALLGMPQAGELAPELELSSDELTQRGATLTIGNLGSGLLAWRVVRIPSWLDAGVQAGVALGDGYDFASGPMPSLLTLSSAAGGVPEGSHRGVLELEFHFPDGRSQTERIAISLDKRGAAFYEAGTPQS